MRAVIGACFRENCRSTFGDPQPVMENCGVAHGIMNPMGINAGTKVLWVRRSSKMNNYPGIWTLFSQQYSPEEILGAKDLAGAKEVFNRMASERLLGAPITIEAYLDQTSGFSDDLKREVHLMLYKIEFPWGLKLNEDYYTYAQWLTWDEHFKYHKQPSCGMCTRLFQDWSYLKGHCGCLAGSDDAR